MNNIFPILPDPEAANVQFIRANEPPDIQAIQIEAFMYSNCFANAYNELFFSFFRFLRDNNITNMNKLEKELDLFHDYLQQEGM